MVASGREYSFRVPGQDSTDRSFTVLIANAAFRQGLLKYQEGPDICYRKLLSALAAEQDDSPVHLRQQVTESEVAEYTAAGRARGRNWTEEQRLAARRRFHANRVNGPSR